MGFGIFKKLKDGFNKARKFIASKVINPVVNVVKKAKPILEKVDVNKIAPMIKGFNPKITEKLDKLKGIQKKALEFSDEIIKVDDMAKNKDYQGIVEYAGHKFIPRLKQ